MKNVIVKCATVLIAAAAMVSPREAKAVHYSKLGIIVAAKSAGKWADLKGWIEQAGYSDEWHAAAFFSDEYPAFAQITNAVVVSRVATCAEVDAILAAARDTAPDALLEGAYARDMTSQEGRRRWHGAFVSRFETNAIERTIRRIDTYEDGYEHIEQPSQRYYTPEEMAERVANRRPKATLEDRIAALNARIAALEQKRSNGTNELEAAHAVIALAAARKTLARLEAARTNEVTVVHTPVPFTGH